MLYRCVLLEITPSKDTVFTNHIEQDFLVARAFVDCMRDNSVKSGNNIVYMYSAIFDLDPNATDDYISFVYEDEEDKEDEEDEDEEI